MAIPISDHHLQGYVGWLLSLGEGEALDTLYLYSHFPATGTYFSEELGNQELRLETHWLQTL